MTGYHVGAVLTSLLAIVKGAGYELSTSLTMLLLLNLGGVAGLLLAGNVADRRGIRGSTVLWFVGATVLLALLSVRLPTGLLNVAVFLTGVFVFSAQVLIDAFITHVYPPTIRGTARGLASGIGRAGSIVGPVITGALVAAGLGYRWGFYFPSSGPGLRRPARRPAGARPAGRLPAPRPGPVASPRCPARRRRHDGSSAADRIEPNRAPDQPHGAGRAPRDAPQGPPQRAETHCQGRESAESS
jgi:MFS family permease